MLALGKPLLRFAHPFDVQTQKARAMDIDLLYRHTWPTRAAARNAIFECIEVFYNRQRRHSTLRNLSPADYESQHATVCAG